jgi:NAD(P)-dependent dehydrogenase (short-subunit alcohol dehydrogenase family)
MKLNGKKALVTGSSQGIGQAIAFRLAEEGADVVINYHSHPETAEETTVAIRKMGRRSVAIQADIGSAAGVQDLVQKSIVTLMPDGSIKHVHVLAQPFKDQFGKVEFVGFAFRLTPALRTGLQRHAQLDSKHPYVPGALVAAGIDNVLKIWLNVCPVEDVERVKNFLYKLIGLHAETGMRMAGDEFGLGLPYIAGNAVITRCYTAGIVWSLRPRGPVVESSEHLKVLK